MTSIRSLAMYTALSSFLVMADAEQKQTPIYVGTGEIGYSDGRELRSERFASCSALILDYKNRAILVHALPSYKPGFLPGSDLVEVNNAVSLAVSKLESAGIDPMQSEAIIHAASKDAYLSIAEDLRKMGIRIRSAEFMPEDNTKIRNINYNPRRNKLKVQKMGFFYGYR